MELFKIVSQAKKAGGYKMTPARKKALFGGDARMAKNVIQMTASQPMIEAAKQGILADHRVVEELWKAGECATGIILGLECRLGRKLPRSRAKTLIQHYLAIRDKRMNLEAAKRFVNALIKAHVTEEATA